MGKVISAEKLITLISDFKNRGQKVVLVGGCFDILHPGHITFLEKAKKAGDILVVLLESDKKVRQLKGVNRPYHSQQLRAKMLTALQAVDFILRLPLMDSAASYDKLVQKIRPDIIALTQGYANSDHQKRAAKLSKAKFKYVTKMLGDHSTSRILDKK
jgi:D-beta-D-heptose 7-phosphate kinase/D-beta-D-heptose 1-phosphate adenosyltransferase